MEVLLTNDDGINAPGLRAIHAALREAGHTVRAVAPARQQSGVGPSLTVFSPLQIMRVQEPDFEGVGVFGTPADCVKLAMARLLPRRPDLLISGINIGRNVGPDIPYSGTVGAAAEGAYENLPTLAVSCEMDGRERPDFREQARHAVRLAERMDWGAVPDRRVLNLNYPAGPLSGAKGVRVCPQSLAVWTNEYDERRDPRGDPYWWMEGSVPPETIAPDTDRALLARGWITLTPLKFEFTDEKCLAALERMDIWEELSEEARRSR